VVSAVDPAKLRARSPTRGSSRRRVELRLRQRAAAAFHRQPDQQARCCSRTTRPYQRTLNALLGEARDATITPISQSDETQSREPQQGLRAFATSAQAIRREHAHVAQAKQSSRNIFTASEALLKTPGELVEGYQEEATTHGYYVAAPCCLPFSRSPRWSCSVCVPGRRPPARAGERSGKTP